MKLVIKRSQKEEKGFLGGSKGVTFKLFCQVQISKEDYSLLNKYQAFTYTLKNYKGDDDKPITINNLLAGVHSERCDNFTRS